jgi:hypothetical protein
MYLYVATDTCLYLSTVQFYGHVKNVDNSLPIKTDKDTLREGYRYGPCPINICMWFLEFRSFINASLFFFYHVKDSFFPRKMTWIRLGRRGWSNVTMTSFLKSILFVYCILHCSFYETC